MSDLKMIRINNKLEQLFNGKIDVSDIPEDQYRAAFCSRAVASLALMIVCSIDEDSASRAITDGFDDLGIDAIYSDDVQKTLFLVQAKWSEDGSGTIGQGEVLKFISGVEKIISLDFAGANEKILSHKDGIDNSIRNMDYQVKLIAAHTGTQHISDVCQAEVDKLLKKTNDETNELVLFEEVNQNVIYTYLASGQTGERIDINDVILTNWGKIDSPFSAYYGTISAAALGDWFQTYGNRLFDRNIRFYKGSTDVNDGIRRVLLSEPENFFYYNNGLKLLCSKISRKSAHSTDNKIGIFALEGVSLVNGAQTTGVIGSLYSDAKVNLEKANVFIQLLDLENTPPEFASQVTKLSNTQNRIDNKDFAALDPQQERIKVEMSFEGIEYFYKSGASILNPSKQASIDEAIVALACNLDDITHAATAKRNVGALVENVGKAPYILLFNPSISGILVWNSVQILRETDKILKEMEAQYYAKDRLALVHGNRFVLHMVFKEYRDAGIEIKAAMLDGDTIKEKTRSFCTAIIPKQIEAMNNVFPDAYPANIFKNVGRCREILTAMTDEREPESEQLQF